MAIEPDARRRVDRLRRGRSAGIALSPPWPWSSALLFVGSRSAESVWLRMTSEGQDSWYRANCRCARCGLELLDRRRGVRADRRDQHRPPALGLAGDAADAAVVPLAGGCRRWVRRRSRASGRRLPTPVAAGRDRRPCRAGACAAAARSLPARVGRRAGRAPVVQHRAGRDAGRCRRDGDRALRTTDADRRRRRRRVRP